RKSMDQITGALVGIGTVLTAVFIPMAFLSGSTGVIYRQFSITIVAAMVLSVIIALTLTPALCVTLLRPVDKNRHGPMATLFTGSNKPSPGINHRYQHTAARMVRRTGRNLLIYAGLAALMGLLFIRLPTSFLPPEDQGWLMVFVQGPVGAT